MRNTEIRCGVIPPSGILFAFLAVCTLQMAFASMAGAQTSTVAFSQSSYTVNEDQSNAVITVVCPDCTNGTVTVDFSTSDGTATAGEDYTATTSNLTFSAVVATNTVSIPIIDDNLLESNQTVNLTLSNLVGPGILGSLSNAVLTILEQTQQVQFAEANFSIPATTSTTNNAVITVVRTATNGTVTVDFSTSNLTATAGINYTATNGTLVFAPGVSTNSFSVTIPPLASPPTTATVSLMLTNPTGEAVLGSQSNAVLTIEGPPVLEFDASNYSVLEHVGTAIATVIRPGDTSSSASVGYFTSDGTATNGTDYVGTSGILNFNPGDSSKSFSFQIIKHKTFQDNKTVNLTLTNAIGAALTNTSTAVVTIVNDRTQTWPPFTTATGDVVTVTLQRAGTMEVSESEPVDITLSNTDASSVLTIKVKKSKGGTGLLEVDSITGDGDCRVIDARNCDLVGPTGVQLGGYLGELRVHDITSDVTAGGDETQNTTISAHDIGDGVTINLGSRIKTLNAAHFGDSTITAPSIGTMTIKGDKRNGIPGDFEGLITLSGPGVPTNNITLGRLAVAGAITNAAISIEDGNVGTVTASQMIDSSFYVGFTPYVDTNAFAGGDFVPDLLLKAVNIKSSSGGFENSFIAAATIGNVRLGSVSTNNAGVEFGVLVGQSMTSLTVRTPPFKWSRTGANDQSLGDFHVVLP